MEENIERKLKKLLKKMPLKKIDLVKKDLMKLDYLKEVGYITEYYILTKKGKKFLEAK